MSDLFFVLCLGLSIAGLSISMFCVGWWKCFLYLNEKKSKKEVKDQGEHNATDTDPTTKPTVK